MKVVYVAGAFRGATQWEVQLNVRAAETAGLEVALAGAMPIVPHKNTEHFHGQLPDKFWLDGTMELMRRCDAVFVFRLRDESRSFGTREEVKEARKLGIPVFYDIDTLRAWLEEARGAWNQDPAHDSHHPRDDESLGHGPSRDPLGPEGVQQERAERNDQQVEEGDQQGVAHQNSLLPVSR